MSKEEMICKNCKYHYIEEISFDYPQSCCSKRHAIIEEWFNCNNFEYSDKYIEQLQQENQKYKEVIDKINLIIKGIAYGGNEDYYMENFSKINELLKEVSE